MSCGSRNHRVPSASCQGTLGGWEPCAPSEPLYMCAQVPAIPGVAGACRKCWVISLCTVQHSAANGVAQSSVHWQGCLLLCLCFYKKYWCLAWDISCFWISVEYFPTKRTNNSFTRMQSILPRWTLERKDLHWDCGQPVWLWKLEVFDPSLVHISGLNLDTEKDIQGWVRKGSESSPPLGLCSTDSGRCFNSKEMPIEQDTMYWFRGGPNFGISSWKAGDS